MPDAGLIKRDQLPLPTRYVGPRTPTEARLAAIWASVLSMDRVGVNDRYHDLGGDSLLATMIFGMIREAFTVEIPIAILVEAASIGELAPRIDALSPKHPPEGDPA
jgi:acyl carrier protein